MDKHDENIEKARTIFDNLLGLCQNNVPMDKVVEMQMFYEKQHGIDYEIVKEQKEDIVKLVVRCAELKDRELVAIVNHAKSLKDRS